MFTRVSMRTYFKIPCFKLDRKDNENIIALLLDSFCKKTCCTCCTLKKRGICSKYYNSS